MRPLDVFALKQRHVHLTDAPGVSPVFAAFLVELLYRAVKRGFTVGETPIIFEDRQRGDSKMSGGEIFGGIANLFRLRFGK